MANNGKNVGANTVQISEGGKTFVGYVLDNGECLEWKHKAYRGFRYKRCAMCGRLIPKHPNQWYSHYYSCLSKQKILRSDVEEMMKYVNTPPNTKG